MHKCRLSEPIKSSSEAKRPLQHVVSHVPGFKDASGWFSTSLSLNLSDYLADWLSVVFLSMQPTCYVRKWLARVCFKGLKLGHNVDES
eukprot:6190181-Pleurochrysis_carterae.AAC.5